MHWTIGLWAYEGWNNLNYVSGEMKDPHRDLPRVIIFGIPVVIFCYMLSNVAYLAALRSEVVMHTNTVAMDFGKKIFGPAGGIIFAVCVALSCFGVNVVFLIFIVLLAKNKIYSCCSLPMQVYSQEHVSSMCLQSRDTSLAFLASLVSQDRRPY